MFTNRCTAMNAANGVGQTATGTTGVTGTDGLLADGLVDVKEAAEFLSVSRTTIYALMETGQLRYVKIGKARRIPRRAMIELAAANLRGGWADASGPAGSASPPDPQLEG
jgi:excisionase family DNA binding protein